MDGEGTCEETRTGMCVPSLNTQGGKKKVVVVSFFLKYTSVVYALREAFNNKA